jgi:integrase
MPYKREGSSKWWITVSGVRQSSGTANLEDAKGLEAKLNHQDWLQSKMGLKKPRSWKEAVVKFLNESKHKASYATITQRLAWWDPVLGDVTDIRTIDREMIDDYISAHRPVSGEPSSANTTANKYAIVVSSVLNMAKDEWKWLDGTPKLRYYPEPPHRRAFLKVEEWRRLEAQLPHHLLMPARFALATGLRAGKVFGLEWSQIDFSERTLTTYGNDVKLGVVIPLNRTAMSVLEEILSAPVRHISRVFCYEGEPLADYGQAWYKALARAGLGTMTKWKDQEGKKHVEWQGFCWHGLRHTFASWLGQSGANEMVIDQLCGWAEKDTRGIYTHLDVEHLRPYAEVIDNKLAAQFATQLENAAEPERKKTA